MRELGKIRKASEIPPAPPQSKLRVVKDIAAALGGLLLLALVIALMGAFFWMQWVGPAVGFVAEGDLPDLTGLLTVFVKWVFLTVVVFVFVGFVADTRGPGMVGASGIVAALLMIFGPF